jgi:hypothetical protein
MATQKNTMDGATGRGSTPLECQLQPCVAIVADQRSARSIFRISAVSSLRITRSTRLISASLGTFPFTAVARGIYELHQQSFNILQVIDSLDAKDHKTVPFASVPVPTVPADSAKQVSSETDVVKLFAAVQSVNAGVATHDAPQSLSEEWIVENLAWQPLRHALDQGPLAGSRWPTRSQLTDLFKFRVVKSRLAVTLILQ